MNASKECLPADNLTAPSPSTAPLLPPPSQITHINLSRDNINNVSLDEWMCHARQYLQRWKQACRGGGVGGGGSEARAEGFVFGIKTNLSDDGEIIRGDIRHARDSFTPLRTDLDGVIKRKRASAGRLTQALAKRNSFRSIYFARPLGKPAAEFISPRMGGGTEWQPSKRTGGWEGKRIRAPINSLLFI